MWPPLREIQEGRQQGTKDKLKKLKREIQRKTWRTYWTCAETLFLGADDAHQPSNKLSSGPSSSSWKLETLGCTSEGEQQACNWPLGPGRVINMQFQSAFSSSTEYSTKEFQSKCQPNPNQHCTCVDETGYYRGGVTQTALEPEPSQSMWSRCHQQINGWTCPCTHFYLQLITQKWHHPCWLEGCVCDTCFQKGRMLSLWKLLSNFSHQYGLQSHGTYCKLHYAVCRK